MFTEYYSVMKMNLLRWFLQCQMAGDLNRSGEKKIGLCFCNKEISIIYYNVHCACVRGVLHFGLVTLPW